MSRTENRLKAPIPVPYTSGTYLVHAGNTITDPEGYELQDPEDIRQVLTALAAQPDAPAEIPHGCSEVGCTLVLATMELEYRGPEFQEDVVDRLLDSKTTALTVQRPVQITEGLIASQLCTFFESGWSNFWVREVIIPEGACTYVYPWQVPLQEGGWVTICVRDAGDSHAPGFRLDRERIERGFNVLAEKYPHIFDRILDEGGDANDADVLIQCALFGEEQYA